MNSPVAPVEQSVLLIAFTGLVLVSLGCSQAGPSAPGLVMSQAPGEMGAEAFTLELEQVFGGDEHAADERSLISRVGPVAVGASGEVYIVDSQAGEIVAFNPNGTVEWRMGRSGEGPGEIQWPSRLLALSDGLLLVNQAGSRLDRYDFNGDYRSGTRLQGGFSLKCVLPDGRLLGDEAVRNEWRLKILTAQSDSEMDSLSVLVDTEFEFDEPAGFGAGMAVTACAGPEILVASPGAYRIHRYSLEGAYLGAFGRTDTGWSPPVTVTGDGAVTLPPFLPSLPLRLGDAGYFMVAQWFKRPELALEIANAMLKGGPSPEREWQFSLDLFDSEGTLLSTLAGDGEAPIGRPFASAGPATIYTYVYSPVPQVRRYRIVLN